MSGFITEYLQHAEIKNVHTKPHLVLSFLVAVSSCMLVHKWLCCENPRKGEEVEERYLQSLRIGIYFSFQFLNTQNL